MLEVHGLAKCPFAWRVRIVAHEKGLMFDWVPFDAPSPDARAAAHNRSRKSPLLWQDGYSLVESLVIAEYLDETGPGRPLLAKEPRERAAARLRIAQIAKKLEAHVTPQNPATDEIRERVASAYQQLDEALAGGQPWLGGADPDLSDLAIWAFLEMLDEGGLKIPASLSRARDYFERARTRPSFLQTRPR